MVRLGVAHLLDQEVQGVVAVTVPRIQMVEALRILPLPTMEPKFRDETPPHIVLMPS